MDMISEAVKRVEDVRTLRAAQVRPEPVNLLNEHKLLLGTGLGSAE